MRISRKYSVANWCQLHLPADGSASSDWEKAAEIFADRMTSRFLGPASKLLYLDRNKKIGSYGFSILALDCICIETIQAFREGQINHHGQSRRLFMDFCQSWTAFLSCIPAGKRPEDATSELYSSIRCALHHSGKTDGVKIDRTGNLAEFSNMRLSHINRNKFHYELREELNRYCSDLVRTGNENLRKNLRDKMNAVCTT